MRPSRAVLMTLAAIATWLPIAAAPQAAARQNHSDAPLPQVSLPLILDSGVVTNSTGKRGVAYSTVLRVRGRPWLRLEFAEVTLGRTPRGGQPTILRLTSVLDGAVQIMNARNLQEWRNTSAYFNGDAVRLEIIADPAAPPSRLRIDHLLAGEFPGLNEGGIATICGPTDDRVLSNEAGNARLLPAGCTAWLISDFNHTFLTAGHCGTSASTIIEFNVPLSSASGALMHPPPTDQYTVDPVSIQNSNNGLGNDYCYFGCFANSTTGLTPFQAQGAFYPLAAAAPPVASPAQTIRVTGYGVVSAPVSPTWNQVQKTHTGPYTALSGTTIQYAVDTTGGNSGSPVFNITGNSAIGIHTNGGCTSTGGANSGTAIHNTGLQYALAHPLGVCTPAPALQFIFPDGLPDNLDPAGDSIRVQVVAGNGGTPQRDTGQLHIDVGDGAGFVTIAMSSVSPNVYDAIVPASVCGNTIRYYFSAQTTTAQTVNEPATAPAAFHSALSAASISSVFSDNFQTDFGWTVSNSPSLTTGAWDRGVPVGGGDRQDPPTDADGSGACYLTQNVDGDSDVDGGSTTLTSPVMDASAPNSSIAYWRWFETTSTVGDDSLLVEVSSNGGVSWVTLENFTSTTGGWFRREWRIDQIAGISPTNQFRIRFTAADVGTATVVEAGIDGVRLSVLHCSACAADIDHSGAVNVNDLLAVITSWGVCPAPPAACPADVNHSGAVNVDDLLAVITSWGPCQ